MAKIILNDNEMEQIKKLDYAEYKEFLHYKIEECAKSGYYSKFTCVKNQEFDRFLIYAPFNENGDKYNETNTQRKARLDLKKYLIEKRNEQDTKAIFDESDYIPISELEKSFNMTRKTIKSIINSNQGIESYVYGRKIFIKKDSVKRFLDNKHYIGTDLSMVNITEKLAQYKNLDIHPYKEQKIKELQSFVQSEEFISSWEKYFEKIPGDLRVYREPFKIINAGIDVLSEEYYLKYIPGIYKIYNPNLKLVGEKHTEIPKLYPLRYVANFFNVGESTMLRYCNKGLVYHYKINGKHMVSQKDINRSFIRISKINEFKKTKKKNVGRKSKFETIFDEVNIIDIDKNNVFSKVVPTEYKEYVKVYKELQLINADIENNTGMYNSFIKEEKSLKRKFIKALLRKEPNLFDLSTDSLNIYYKYQRNYKSNQKQISQAKKLHQNDLVKSLTETNTVLNNSMYEMKNKILSNAISHLNTKYL